MAPTLFPFLSLINNAEREREKAGDGYSDAFLSLPSLEIDLLLLRSAQIQFIVFSSLG